MADISRTAPPPPGPGIAAARARHLAWARRFGLIGGERHAARYVRWRITELAALTYPAASGADLDVTVDTLGWFTLLDDQYDGTRRFRAGELADLRDELMDRMTGRATGPSRVPLVRAWADLGPRILAGMSRRWQARAAASWRELLDACVVEADLTAEGPHAVETYLTVRRAAVMGDFASVLLERAARCELPDPVWEDPHIARVRRCVADVALLLNDRNSLPRELARGDDVNLAVVLHKARGLSVPQALEELRARERDAVAQLAAERQAFLDSHRAGPVPPGPDAVTRFLAGAQDMVTGLRAWYATTGRYAGPETAPGAAGDVADILTPLPHSSAAPDGGERGPARARPLEQPWTPPYRPD